MRKKAQNADDTILVCEDKNGKIAQELEKMLFLSMNCCTCLRDYNTSVN